MAKYKVILEVEITEVCQENIQARISAQGIEDYIKNEIERNEDLRVIRSYARDIE